MYEGWSVCMCVYVCVCVCVCVCMCIWAITTFMISDLSKYLHVLIKTDVQTHRNTDRHANRQTHNMAPEFVKTWLAVMQYIELQQ